MTLQARTNIEQLWYHHKEVYKARLNPDYSLASNRFRDDMKDTSVHFPYWSDQGQLRDQLRAQPHETMNIRTLQRFMD